MHNQMTPVVILLFRRVTVCHAHSYEPCRFLSYAGVSQFVMHNRMNLVIFLMYRCATVYHA